MVLLQTLDAEILDYIIYSLSLRKSLLLRLL